MRIRAASSPVSKSLAQLGQCQSKRSRSACDERLLPRRVTLIEDTDLGNPDIPVEPGDLVDQLADSEGCENISGSHGIALPMLGNLPHPANLIPQIEQLHRQRRQSLSSCSLKARETRNGERLISASGSRCTIGAAHHQVAKRIDQVILKVGVEILRMGRIM